MHYGSVVLGEYARLGRNRDKRVGRGQPSLLGRPKARRCSFLSTGFRIEHTVADAQFEREKPVKYRVPAMIELFAICKL